MISLLPMVAWLCIFTTCSCFTSEDTCLEGACGGDALEDSSMFLLQKSLSVQSAHIATLVVADAKHPSSHLEKVAPALAGASQSELGFLQEVHRVTQQFFTKVAEVDKAVLAQSVLHALRSNMNTVLLGVGCVFLVFLLYGCCRKRGVETCETLDAFIANTVTSFPDAVAIEIPLRGKREKITYSMLNTASTALAVLIRQHAKDNEKQHIIAIIATRTSISTFVAVVATWKACKAVLHVPPEYPEERTKCIVEDAGAVLALVGLSISYDLGIPHVQLQRWWETEGMPLKPSSKLAPWKPAQATGLAYVIYTSGTTGKPKGVEVEHGQISNLISSNLDYFELGVGNRIGQVASLAFDASMEEMLLAWSTGATLVILPAVEDFGDWLKEERITLVTPTPSVLRLARSRAKKNGYPDLRYVYPGGEATSQDDVDTWGQLNNVRLENAYGPTECAITVVRGPLRAGEPVVIGQPVENNTAWIRGVDNDLNSQEAEEGEMCISGAQVARGYLGLPELTQKRFPTHPKLGRMYYTGDLVCRTEDGRLVCKGRIDAQVKVNGVRMELEEIEMHMQQLPGVSVAACKVQGTGNNVKLVAFVVPEKGFETALSMDSLRDALRKSLPAAMVPTMMQSLSELPLTVGGKLDRKSLPDIAIGGNVTLQKPPPPFQEIGAPSGTGAPEPSKVVSAQSQQAASEDELLISTEFSRFLGFDCAPDTDFFKAGGTSYTSALLVNELRSLGKFASISMKEVYANPTPASLASRLAHLATSAQANAGSLVKTLDKPLPVTETMRYYVWTMQVLFGIVELLIEGWLGLIVLENVEGAVQSESFTITMIWMYTIFMSMEIFLCNIALFSAGIIKRIVMPVTPSGTFPVYGQVYLRHWICHQANGWLDWEMLQGTEFFSIAMRWLGATVGKNVYVNEPRELGAGGWDLLTIGDNVTFQVGSYVRISEFADHNMTLGPVTIDAGSTLATHSLVSANAYVEKNCFLEGTSVIAQGGRGVADMVMRGNPAEPVENAPIQSYWPKLNECEGEQWSQTFWGIMMITGRMSFSVVHLTLEFAALTAAVVLTCKYDGTHVTAKKVLDLTTTSAMFYVFMIMMLLLEQGVHLVCEAMIIRMLAVPLGKYHLRSWPSLLIHLGKESTSAAMHCLAASIYFPGWMRLAGANIGHLSEFEDFVFCLPGTVTIGAECQFGSAVVFESPFIHRNTVNLTSVDIGDRCFMAHSTIPLNTPVPNDSFIGIATRAPDNMAPGAYFGCPPFLLPKREVIEIEDKTLTLYPPKYLVAARGVFDIIYMLLDELKAVLMLVCLGAFLTLRSHVGRLLAGPLALLVTGAIHTSFALAMKWVIIGKITPGHRPMWSKNCFLARFDLIGRVMSGLNTHSIHGTPWANNWLRALGCTIGKDVFIWDSGSLCEPDTDLLEIMDGATCTEVASWCHLFEDRIMKNDWVRIGKDSSVQADAQLLPGNTVGNGALVVSGAIIPKGEQVQDHHRAEGHPAVQRPR